MSVVAAQQIRAEHPEVAVLVLSQYVEPGYAMRLIEQHPERRSGVAADVWRALRIRSSRAA